MQVEALKTRKSAQQMSQLLRKMNPALAAVLIDERDEVINKILQHPKQARHLQLITKLPSHITICVQIMVQNLRNLKGRVVGVVGLAHLDGIERIWRDLQEGRS